MLLESKLFVNTTHLAMLPKSSKRNLMTLLHDHPMAGVIDLTNEDSSSDDKEL